jgi:hypothetical protein
MADARSLVSGKSALCETHALSRFPSFLGGSLSASVGLGFESRRGWRMGAGLSQISRVARSTLKVINKHPVFFSRHDYNSLEKAIRCRICCTSYEHDYLQDTMRIYIILPRIANIL